MQFLLALLHFFSIVTVEEIVQTDQTKKIAQYSANRIPSLHAAVEVTIVPNVLRKTYFVMAIRTVRREKTKVNVVSQLLLTSAN